MLKKISVLVSVICFASLASAKTIHVDMYRVAKKGHGSSVGKIELTDTKYGLLILPDLSGLPRGIHGFHLHEVPNCDNNGLAAGGHFDPNHTGRHAGPYSDVGHLGDLPALTVNAQGQVTLPVLAPRLTTKDLRDHALIIHAGGDNYTDHPKLGGGGARMVCGVVK